VSRGGVLARVAALGASTQAAVPAVYAWSLTVRPIAFARGANLGAQLAGAAAFLAFVAAPLVDRRAPGWGRRLLLVGGLGGCAGAWAFAPRGVTVGATAATLGAIGWALFAFALAGPVLRRAAPAPGTLEDPDDEPVVPSIVARAPPAAALARGSTASTSPRGS
jgi:hypothetical protein